MTAPARRNRKKSVTRQGLVLNFIYDARNILKSIAVLVQDYYNHQKMAIEKL